MKKFICVRGWKRNPTNDIIEEWEYNKLPDDVKNRNFKEYVVKPDTEPVTEVSGVEETPSSTDVHETKPTHSRFKTFTVDDDDYKEE